jgi:hypothetical protein
LNKKQKSLPILHFIARTRQVLLQTTAVLVSPKVVRPVLLQTTDKHGQQTNLASTLAPLKGRTAVLVSPKVVRRVLLQTTAVLVSPKVARRVLLQTTAVLVSPKVARRVLLQSTAVLVSPKVARRVLLQTTATLFRAKLCPLTRITALGSISSFGLPDVDRKSFVFKVDMRMADSYFFLCAVPGRWYSSCWGNWWGEVKIKEMHQH